MSQTDTSLENILLSFITEQRKFNDEQRKFNDEQRKFNDEQRKFNGDIEKKIDKTQYFLEEFITNTAKMFIEEQTKQAAHIRMLDDEVANLKSNIYEISLQLRALQKA